MTKRQERAPFCPFVVVLFSRYDYRHSGTSQVLLSKGGTLCVECVVFLNELPIIIFKRVRL